MYYYVTGKLCSIRNKHFINSNTENKRFVSAILASKRVTHARSYYDTRREDDLLYSFTDSYIDCYMHEVRQQRIGREKIESTQEIGTRKNGKEKGKRKVVIKMTTWNVKMNPNNDTPRDVQQMMYGER
jgi:hypothetical protein